MPVEITKLREQVSKDKTLEALCLLLSGRERTRKDTTAMRVVRLLKERGITVSKVDMVGKFGLLEGLGLGRIVSTRKGVRLIWAYDPISVAKAALGDDSPLKSVTQVMPRELMHTVVKPPQSGVLVIRGAGVTIEVPSNTSGHRLNELIQAIRVSK